MECKSYPVRERAYRVLYITELRFVSRIVELVSRHVDNEGALSIVRFY